MRASVWLTSLVLASFAIACGDQPTEVVPERDGEMALGPGGVALATSSTEDGLSITTDKDDYAPGDTVWFTGAGWPAGDVLDIVLTDDPTHDYHEWTVEVGEDGAFRDSTYVVDVGDIDVTFTLTATSRMTQRSLSVTFTDGNPQTVTVVTGQAPTPVTAGNNATYTVQVNYAGNSDFCTVSLSAMPEASPAWPAPPPGGFFSFSPSSVTGRGSGGPSTPAINPQATLTVTAPAGMSANTYRFKITATASEQPNERCQGPGATSAAINFVVASPANAAPEDPANLAQFKSDASTTIPTGGATNETSVVLTGTVTDPNAGNTVKLQVEVKPIGTAFTNIHTAESALLASGSTAAVSVGSLVNGTSYHWQARAVDNNGAASAWVSFGGNAESAADFTVDTDPPTVTINQAATQGDPTNTSPINFTAVFSEPVTGFDGTDVTLGGTAGATTATVTGGPTTFNVAVSGMIGDGTVAASIAAGVAQDVAGNSNAASTSTDNTVTYDATPPVVSSVQAAPNPSNGTGNVDLTATATDALTEVTSAEYNIDGGTFSPMSATDGAYDELAEDVRVTISAASLAEGSHTLCVRATDEATNTSGNAAACTTLIVDRTPPAISNFSVDPNPVAVNTPLTISATFTDALTNVTGAEYSLGGTAGPWAALPSALASAPYGDSKTEHGSITITLPIADVHDVCVRSTDQVNNTNQVAGTNPIQCIFLAVYDPSAGFVTGGGWIESPAGACRFAACTSSTVGKATFGFVSKYVTQGKEKTPQLTGNTEFQFQAGDLNFKSTNYEWLVVNGGSGRAQYKGLGTVNGGGAYGFMLTAFDGSPDRFRIKIWVAATDEVIYDNWMGSSESSNDATALSGGSIIIHVPKK